MSEFLKFDTDVLEEVFSELPSSNTAYFVSSCAERLLPVIKAWRPEIANLCSVGIKFGWDGLLHEHVPQSIHNVRVTLQNTYEDVVKMVPDVYIVTHPLTEYAIHSVVCVLQYAYSGDHKYAIAAGRCVLNAVSVAVTWQMGIGEDGLHPQERINASSMVQQELKKQRADLSKLNSSSISANMIQDLRLESQEMGQQLVQFIQHRLEQQATSWKTVRSRYERNLDIEGYVQYFHPAGIVVKLDEETQGVLRFDAPNVDSQKHLLRAWTKITGTVTDYDEENQLVILELLQIYAP